MNNRAIANLTLQLQKSLDSNYDVVDMQTVLFIIQQLENTTITKEQLETTRLAKYINELRRRTSSEPLARRAKNLLKKWRDIFMPALQQQQQQSAVAAAGLPASASRIVTDISAGIHQSQQPQQQPQHRQHLASVASAHQSSQAIVVNTFPTNSSSNNGVNKLSTGSANNTNNSKISYLSNGGIHQQQQHTTHSGAKLPAANAFGTQIISSMMYPAVSTLSNACGRRQHYQPPSISQPTSFANVLSTAKILHPASSSAPTSLNTSLFSHCPSESLPHITQHHRQSPVSLLDYDSNHSRPQLASSKVLQNGEINMVAGTVANLHDSNSVTIDIAAAAGDEHHSNHQTLEPKSSMYSIPPANVSATGVDVCSSSSSHRKSKKHKKEKKRPKQSSDKPPPTSEAFASTSHPKLVDASQGTPLFLNQFVEEIRPVTGAEEELHDTAGGGGTTVFPPHDSLSSSSMSRFPSNISTNTMTMQNSSRILHNSENIVNNQHHLPNASDLTFAGKFKSSGKADVGDVAMINEQQNALTCHASLKKSYSDSKDSSDVVVVESRSCSPFITAQMGPDDSCSSSSRATMTVETLNLNVESNLDSAIEQKSIQSQQRLQQPSMGQQDQGSSCNNSSQAIGMSAPPSITSVEPQGIEAVAVPLPKKRGRKKGSRGFDAVIAQTHAFLNASMFERPRFLLGSKKVKTTKELLADIQNRKLASSATSSPTLAINHQSASPSTCSEASFQSDLTNTRASLINLRSSPELTGTLLNCRQSDIDDVNSATDSNDVVAPPAKKAATNEKVIEVKKAVATITSVDEYLNNLSAQLPPIDYTKLGYYEPDIICTCAVRIVENDASKAPKQEVVNVDEKAEHSIQGPQPPPPSSISAPPSMKIDVKFENAICAEDVGLVVQSGLANKKSSPKKQVKSIFDLDYDEDNDPLHSFVEAVKLRVSEESAQGLDTSVEVISKHPTNFDGREDGNRDTSDSEARFGRANPVVNTGSSPIVLLSNQTATVSQNAFASQPATAIPNGDYFDSLMVPEMMPPPIFPQYEVVEDAKCEAKRRYELQTNCITQHHLNLLHNCYIGNVNGNWSAPVVMTAEHRKRLRRYLMKLRAGTAASSGLSNNAEFKLNSWWSNESKALEFIHCDNSSTPNDDESLFDRVVPQYDHIVMDRVVKDLRNVKFTNNYIKRKLRRLKRQAEKLTLSAADKFETNATNVESNASEDNAMIERKKRKRTLSSQENSSHGNDNVQNEGDCDISNEKHKPQRRKKHKKGRYSNIETNNHVDINLSRSDIKDANVSAFGNDGSGLARNPVEEAFSIENSKPNRFSDTDNACDVDISQTQATVLYQSQQCKDTSVNMTTEQTEDDISTCSIVCHANNNPSAPITRERYGDGEDGFCRISGDLNNKIDDYVNEKGNVDVTFIESSSNSSISCTSNINNNSSDKNKDNNQLSTMMSMLHDDEGSNTQDYSYYSGDGDVDMGAGDGGGGGGGDDGQHGVDEDVDDDVDDDEYEDDDEDYDDDHNNDEEHEVVTHDMTSSTSTTSQQHIVLTIKKKVSKSTSSHINMDGSEIGKVLPLRLSSGHILQDHNLPIITSSTPTTIKIRRKNNHQQQEEPSQEKQKPDESGEYGRKKDYHEHDHLTHIDYSDILDNNNIKNGIDLQPNKTSPKALIVASSISANDVDHQSTIGMMMSSALGTQFVDEQICTPNFSGNIAVNDEQEAAFIKKGSEHESGRNLVLQEGNYHASSPKSSSVNEALHPKQSMNSKENESTTPVQQHENVPQCGGDGGDDEYCSADEYDDEEEAEHELDKENNRLLTSFNELTDDNILGLRVQQASSQSGDKISETDAATRGDATDLQPYHHVQEFKEWHEVLVVPSYNNELLTVLPYVVID